MTRTGKIARLPYEVREELNQRLRDGEPCARLIDWLNGLPEAQRALKMYFGGRPINKVNMSEWKNGGYCEWLAGKELVAKAQEQVSELGEVGSARDAEGARFTDHLGTVFAARYSIAVMSLSGGLTEEFRRKHRVLRRFCQDINNMRRADHSRGRLDLAKDKLEWKQRPKTEEGGVKPS